MINESGRKAINVLVQFGIDQMRDDDFNESKFAVWIEYSNKILELATKENPNIHLNYLRLNLSYYDKQLSAKQRLSLCLEYLIGVLKII